MSSSAAAGRLETLPVSSRLARVLLEFSSALAHQEGSGALVQVWMPERAADGTDVLSASGLPFSVCGVGDLLALFRCVSIRYRFSSDVHKPSLMGAIGRVYASCEPEMSNDVQQYDRQVYLRVSEAQRCRVHSTIVVPVFSDEQPSTPVAVFELVQSDKACCFPSVISWLQRCLQAVQLHSCSLDVISGQPRWLRPGDDGFRASTAAAAATAGAFGQRLLQQASGGFGGPALLMMDAPGERGLGAGAGGSSQCVVMEEEDDEAQRAAGPAGKAAQAGAAQGLQRRGSSSGEPSAGSTSQGLRDVQDAAGAGAGAGPRGGRETESTSTSVGVPGGSTRHSRHAAPELAAAAAAAAAAGGAGIGGMQSQVEPLMDRASLPMSGVESGSSGPSSSQAEELSVWMSTHGIGAEALKALLLQSKEQQGGGGLHNALSVGSAGAGGGGGGGGSSGAQYMLKRPSLLSSQSLPPLPSSLMDPLHRAELQPAAGAVFGGGEHAAAGQPFGGQQQQQQQQQQMGVAAPASAAAMLQQRRAGGGAGGSGRPVSGSGTAGGDEAGEEDDDDEIGGSDGDEDDSDGEGGGAAGGGGGGGGHRRGGGGANNRVGGGAGKRLRYEDLQSQFGLGLKEAANNLGICATTLKRACRRHGIKRWPRRQIAKLSKALNSMGYQGAPPAVLVQSAVKSGGAGRPAAAVAAASAAANGPLVPGIGAQAAASLGPASGGGAQLRGFGPLDGEDVMGLGALQQQQQQQQQQQLLLMRQFQQQQQQMQQHMQGGPVGGGGGYVSGAHSGSGSVQEMLQQQGTAAGLYGVTQHHPQQHMLLPNICHQQPANGPLSHQQLYADFAADGIGSSGSVAAQLQSAAGGYRPHSQHLQQQPQGLQQHQTMRQSGTYAADGGLCGVLGGFDTGPAGCGAGASYLASSLGSGVGQPTSMLLPVASSQLSRHSYPPPTSGSTHLQVGAGTAFSYAGIDGSGSLGFLSGPMDEKDLMGMRAGSMGQLQVQQQQQQQLLQAHHAQQQQQQSGGMVRASVAELFNKHVPLPSEGHFSDLMGDGMHL